VLGHDGGAVVLRCSDSAVDRKQQAARAGMAEGTSRGFSASFRKVMGQHRSDAAKRHEALYHDHILEAMMRFA